MDQDNIYVITSDFVIKSYNLFIILYFYQKKNLINK